MYEKLLAAFLVLTAVQAQRQLPKYNVDRTAITVSGVSSGACAATQLHVAFSSTFSGAAIFAGVPYYCTKGSYIQAATCAFPNRIDVLDLVQETQRFANRGEIDNTNGMYNDKVFIFNGLIDSVVSHETADKVDAYYRYFTRSENIKLVKIQAEHTIPTMDYGNACDVSRSPYISRCDYYLAYEALNFLYGGNLTRPGYITGLFGDFYRYDQKEFLSGLTISHSMEDYGYVYVPSGCIFNQNRCKLHVALHGCQQGSFAVGDTFARYAGYAEVGELNNIIMLYPQAQRSLNNPLGCWDWWGYTNNNFAVQRGPQMAAIQKMINRIS